MKGEDYQSIIDFVRANLNVSELEAKLYVKVVFAAMRNRLEHGEELCIKGLVSFYYQTRKGRTVKERTVRLGRLGGKTMTLPAVSFPDRNILKCQIAGDLKKMLRDVQPKIDPETGEPNWVPVKHSTGAHPRNPSQPKEGLSK